MAGFFQRVWWLFKGKTNRVLDKIENPDEQLSVFVEELNDQVRNLQRAVAAAIADEKRLKMEFDEITSQAHDWEMRAILALENNDESLAKEALLKKDDCEKKAVIVKQTWETQKESTKQLKYSLNASKERVDDAKRQYTLLLARYKSAETKKKLADVCSMHQDNSPMQIMENLNNKILQIESEAEASLGLMGDSIDQDIEKKFADLEYKKRGDEALQQLKDKLASQKSLDHRNLLGNTNCNVNQVEELKAKLKK
ncbi:MAG: PspA/IM30 family protein [bacterium]